MIYFLVGLFLFIGVHLIPSFPTFKNSLINKTNDKVYKLLFSVISLICFYMLVIGIQNSPFIHLYNPPSWGRHLNMLIMLPALYCFLSNSVFTFVPSSVPKLTQHPLNWGVVLWSAGHLLANGDLVNVLLFGTFGLFSLFSIYTSNKRGATKKTLNHSTLAEVIFALVVLGIYVGVLFGHQFISGIPLV